MSLYERPIECQIFLTRKCNLSCEYCIVPSRYQKSAELILDQWKLAIGKLTRWDIKHIKLLGGEPTQSPHILPLLRFLRDETALDCLVISNSVFNESMLRKLVDAGLTRYVTSVDDVGLSNVGDIARKSNQGLHALRTLQSWGLTDLAANVVISATNVGIVHDTIEYLLTSGFGVNVCPVIVGQGEVFWEYRTNRGANIRLSMVAPSSVDLMVQRLLNLKARFPERFLATNDYLQGLRTFGVHLNWKCWEVSSTPPQLRLDSDGTFMLCPDIRGNLNLNVLDMTDDDYAEYLNFQWKQEVERVNCPGCYWSSMVLSAERGIAY
jgi:molybdenum cofactor biosynthesis enzyme MoaA